MIEVGFRFVERALFDFHIRLRLMETGRRLIDISLRRVFAGEELLRSRRTHLREFEAPPARWPDRPPPE